MRKRVVFIINSLTGGGAERTLTTLLSHSISERNTYDVSLVLLDVEEQAYLFPKGVEVHQLDCRHSLWRSELAMWRLLRALRADIAVSFLTRSNMVNIVTSRLLRRPCIISERTTTSSHFKRSFNGFISRKLVRLLYPRADRIIAVSSGIAKDLIDNFAVPEDRIDVIANPVDVDGICRQAAAPTALSIDGRYIVTMGRLIPSKNFDLLIDAFAASRVADRLLIIGEGPERARLEQKIEALGLSGRVSLPGFMANPFGVLRGAEFFVLPSNREGFPNGLVEAMALGVPVLSTNCPSGPAEILAGREREQVDGLFFGEYGILVPMDSVTTMVHAMQALTDPEMRAKYRKNGRQRVNDFGVERSKNLYWKAIGEHLAQGSPPVRRSVREP